MNPKFNSHIAYLILTKNSELTFFNHYENQHIKYRNIISQILKFPKDITEIYLSKEELINIRMTGIVNGYYIDFINNIDDIYNIKYKTKFIIVSDMLEVETIYKNIAGIPFVFLSSVLDTNEELNLYNFNDLDIGKFQSIFEKILQKQDKQTIEYCNKLKEYTFSRNRTELFINTDISITKNLYTLSNFSSFHSSRCGMPIRLKITK